MALIAPTTCHRSPFRLRKQYEIYLLHHSQHPRAGPDQIPSALYNTRLLHYLSRKIYLLILTFFSNSNLALILNDGLKIGIFTH